MCVCVCVCVCVSFSTSSCYWKPLGEFRLIAHSWRSLCQISHFLTKKPHHYGEEKGDEIITLSRTSVLEMFHLDIDIEQRGRGE